MTHRSIPFCASVCTLVLALSCKSSGESPTTPPPGQPGEPATATETTEPARDDVEPGAPGVPWAEKTFKQRQEFMGITFMPAMKTSFKAHDEAAFQGFKCQTCHGDDMKERNFEMPSDSIYPLPKENTIEAAMEYDEEITKFMVEKVVPEAAALIGEEPYDPATGQGHFGCFECHPAE